MLDAAQKEAKRVERQNPKVHHGVPTYFRACCVEARNGGEWGYANAGYHLASALYSQMPYDGVDDDEWGTEVDTLLELLADGDGDGVWQWFGKHYPKCMKLVPSRRKERFVKGVLLAHEEGRIDG